MARTGTPTGRTAIPTVSLTIPGSTFDMRGSGVGPGLGVVPDTTIHLSPEGAMALGFSSGGLMGPSFAPTNIGSGGLAEVIINRGVDLATAIINRGAQQQPTVVGGGGMIPGTGGLTLPAPTAPIRVESAGPAGLHVTPPWSQDVSLSAFAPSGGWPTNKDGTPRRVRRDGRPWKRPAMNVANPRALGRSMRRVEGFAKLAKRTIRFTTKVKMKKRGRR